MIIRRALSGVKKKIRPRRRAVLVLVLGRVRAAGLGAKTFYRVTSVAQLAALQRPKPASRNTHQTKAIAIGDGGGIGLGRCDLFGGQLMLTGLQADIGIQLCRGDVLRQTASSLMTYHTVIQMRQRMRVSSSFFILLQSLTTVFTSSEYSFSSGVEGLGSIFATFDGRASARLSLSHFL